MKVEGRRTMTGVGKRGRHDEPVRKLTTHELGRARARDRAANAAAGEVIAGPRGQVIL